MYFFIVLYIGAAHLAIEKFVDFKQLPHFLETNATLFSVGVAKVQGVWKLIVRHGKLSPFTPRFN